MLISRRGALALGSLAAAATFANVGAGRAHAAAFPHASSAPLRSATALMGLFDARRKAFPMRTLLPEQLPYAATFARPLPSGPNYDENSVAIRVYDGVTHNHPVAQAQAALSILGSYSFNNDPSYLAASRANADRLIETAHEVNGALFFPYTFDFALHGGKGVDVMVAPWYSGMAQGQALSAFCRLYEVTGDEKYRTAADGAYESFKILKNDSTPWVTRLDAHGYAWFEEYADSEGRPDFTFNGHVFGVYGLFDYHRMTGSAEAKTLFQIGATTMKDYADTIRVPGRISHYCLRHETPSISYHNVHVELCYKLYDMTGDLYFASLADALLEDFPPPTAYGDGPISKGQHRFATTNASASSKAVVTTATTAAIASVKYGSRRKLVGTDGIWLRIDSGEHAGKWIEEKPNDTHIIGLALERYRFAPLRRINFAAGTHTGYEYSKGGKVTRSVRAGLRAPSGAHASMRALVNGKTHYLITNGIWKDLWVPESDAVRPATVSLTGKQITGWDPDEEPPAGTPVAIDPVKLVRFAQGNHTGYEFNDEWQVVRSKTAGLRAPSGAYADRKVNLDSGTYYRITGGIWKDLWVLADDRAVPA